LCHTLPHQQSLKLCAGEPFVVKKAVCLHEEDAGLLWKHVEYRNGQNEVRRSRRLVISMVRAPRACPRMPGLQGSARSLCLQVHPAVFNYGVPDAQCPCLVVIVCTAAADCIEGFWGWGMS
jgi:hypothetical protein